MFEITRVEEVSRYAPNVGNNRELAEPFTVLISPMSAAELRQADAGFGVITKGDVNLFERYAAFRAHVFERCVREIHGLAVRRVTSAAAKIEPVTTVADLLKYGTDEILDDVFSAIKDHSRLEAGLVKK